ncbi:hypothetical protein V8E52_004026 [Russula decolorans]
MQLRRDHRRKLLLDPGLESRFNPRLHRRCLPPRRFCFWRAAIERNSGPSSRQRQIARPQARIATLEGSSSSNLSVAGARAAGGSSVDDFSIKNAASQLERTINRWASDILRVVHVPPVTLRDAALADLAVYGGAAADGAEFAAARGWLKPSQRGDPTVAAVWRRQTFTAAVENVASETTRSIFAGHLPTLAVLLKDQPDDPLWNAHGPAAADAFYRSFIPELGSTLYPRQVELAKRCRRSERGEVDRVGETIFPGLVKVSRNLPGPGVASGDTANTVRAANANSNVERNYGNRNTSEFLNLPFKA